MHTLCTYAFCTHRNLQVHILQIMQIFSTCVLGVHMYSRANIQTIPILCIYCYMPINVHIMNTFWDITFNILDRNYFGYPSGCTRMCVHCLYMYILCILCTRVQKVHMYVICTYVCMVCTYVHVHILYICTTWVHVYVLDTWCTCEHNVYVMFMFIYGNVTINVNVHNVCNLYIYIDMYYMCLVILYAVVVI